MKLNFKRYNLNYMDVMEAIIKRRTVKKFKEELASKEEIEAALTAACWAPSHRNSQPWEFRVLSGHAKEKLGEIYMNRIMNHPKMPPEKKDKKLSFAQNFGGAPVIVVALCRKSEKQREYEESLEAMGAAIQNFYLALHSKGLATAWLTPSVLMDDEEVDELISLTPGFKVVGVLPVGYPLEVPSPKDREGLDKKVIWID